MAERHDPLRDLRLPHRPVAPDPGFAVALRARIERALHLPTGVTVSAQQTETQQTGASSAAVPYLCIDGARRAIEWYSEIFGAEVVGEPYVGNDGRIGHAELGFPHGGSIYLADVASDLGYAPPQPGAVSVSLMLPVDDADEVRRRAMAAGATGDRAPYDGYGSRNAWIDDPFGHRWGLHSPLPGGSQD
ncbi:MAG: VOC family protein [Mycobacteriales bacterium]